MSLLNRPKVDMSKMTDEEKKMFRMYGKLPTAKDVLNHKLKDRKYFDSGDYALSKAGKQATVGSKHPSPDSIPHSSPSSHEKSGAGPTSTTAANAASSTSTEKPSGLTHIRADGEGEVMGKTTSNNQLDSARTATNAS